MLMSDRDIRASIEAGEIGLEPLDMSLLQPSSFDVRIDRFFRLFDNHKYAFIDPAEQQDDLTGVGTAAVQIPLLCRPQRGSTLLHHDHLHRPMRAQARGQRPAREQPCVDRWNSRSEHVRARAVSKLAHGLNGAGN